MTNKAPEDKKWMLEHLYKTRQFVVGTMTILQVNGKEVSTGRTKIYLEELSMEKIRFISKVQIPENSDVLLGLNFQVAGQDLDFKATIIGMHANTKKRKYTYLVELITEDDQDIQTIHTFVNKIQLANKQKKLRSVTETAVEVE
ncbi:hypothetical protein [Sutcliffiella rhizosphaerae]|uniref:PilZ domain-containing protein n=1 Tax=Sutcliffiella rhizosphaerae TaxID=2880967 RepID=A0ABM8YNY6_9BACI|nr:hypothetical protein [Sutcliffiella rhizosphaerae]CAG9621470.1 hypothetical protein BACCIP111883_02243 [Sutcliffiella rhizosphaerae]